MKELFMTTCPHCGKEFRVPFDPNKTDREILCPKCFADKRDHPGTRTIVIVKLSPEDQTAESDSNKYQ